ncbi:hypothetical protein KUCAC02_008940 [Chaenocephalus aceratus]|uniref:Uncharacterized protein n=1 Tax=Chaenocephalus aceratus TaxID=36190 RepID=A0ACB9WSX1_CHAAC|nr:hypothetical protein KUCAC02_008940 [Chaenocephalus aceratus]
MKCARALHAFGTHTQPAAMPADLAACLTLGHRQHIYQLLSKTPLNPAQHRYQPANSLPRSGLNSPRSSSPFHASSLQPPSPLSSEPRSCFRRDSGYMNKKRVVFADAIGLALTAVRLFISEPSSLSSEVLIKPTFARLQGQQSPSNNLQRCKLRLGFPQPAFDHKAFLTRGMRVQLESCNISENSLSGKVLVSHVGIDEAVQVRMTFDSWRSHHDIPCKFLQQQHYGGSDLNLFTFDLSLPKNIDPKERAEFFVYFKAGPGATLHWDNNQGQNYRVFVETDGSNGHQEDAFRGYTTLSQYRPMHTTLSNHNCTDSQRKTIDMQNYLDSQSLQRGLSGRVREWREKGSARQ